MRKILTAALMLAVMPAAASDRARQDRAVMAAERAHAARDGGSRACLTYGVDGETPDHIDVVVRERHGNACPGDPATAPVRDRYRIAVKGDRVQRYDPVTGDYVDVRPAAPGRGGAASRSHR